MRIYTHGFSAHADELLACAILLAVKRPESVEILRVKAEELPEVLEKDCYIVDIGGIHNGVDRFDHHQDEESVKGECAATLVAKAFAPELLEDPDWGSFLGRVAYQDNNGVPAVMSRYGVSTNLDVFLRLERVLVSRFEKDPVGASRVVADAIISHLDFMDEVRRAERWLLDYSRVVTLGPVKALVLDRDPRVDGIDLPACNYAQRSIIKAENISVVVNFDPRSPMGEVRTLFRTPIGEAAGLDFTKSEADLPLFCHKGGFLLTYRPSSDDEWQKLIAQAR